VDDVDDDDDQLELPNPRRPMKRKSQDYDRNFLSESGSIPSSTRHNNTDFWLPKVKITPSMVTNRNAEILAQFQHAQAKSSFLTKMKKQPSVSASGVNNNNSNTSKDHRRDEHLGHGQNQSDEDDAERKGHQNATVIGFEFLHRHGLLSAGERITDVIN
jgi:hypothetical protein